VIHARADYNRIQDPDGLNYWNERRAPNRVPASTDPSRGISVGVVRRDA
jgi:hypothetical protein